MRPRGSSAISNPESGNSILLGTGASPPESGNSILDQNTIKREVAFMGAIPCGRNSTFTVLYIYIYKEGGNNHEFKRYF